MSVKNVEMVRAKAATELTRAVQRFRIWLSCTDGNREAVDMIAERRDSPDDKLTRAAVLVASLVEITMEHVGVATEVTADNQGGSAKAFSHARRAVSKRI